MGLSDGSETGHMTRSCDLFTFKQLYSLNYIIFKISLSCPNGKILKFIITLYLLISIYISSISKLIILSLYSTSSPEIITNK